MQAPTPLGLKTLALISLYGLRAWDPDAYAMLDDAHMTAVNRRTVRNLIRDGYLEERPGDQVELTELGRRELEAGLPIDDLVDRFAIAGFPFVTETRGWPDRDAAESCCVLIRSGLDLIARDDRLPSIESVHTQLVIGRHHPLAQSIIEEAAQLTLARYRRLQELPQLALRAVWAG